jgi:hypothetical protein
MGAAEPVALGEGVCMNKLMIALLGLALAVPVMAVAQSSQSNDQQAQRHEQQEQIQAAEVNDNGSSTLPVHHMTGMVSQNGERFTSDNTEYAVANPHMLKKYNGQTVSVKFDFNTQTNQIHILSVDQK